MRKKIIIVCLLFLGTGIGQRASAQADEIAQLLLNVEKLAQFKTILDDMKKGYKILTGGYNTIKNLSEGNFSLHKNFLDGLMQVSPEVRNYRKVAGIVDYQIRLVKEYKTAFSRFRSNEVFRPDEIDYMARVYENLFRQSLKNLDELAMVITANQLRMSDEERLTAIDRIFDEMGNKLAFLRDFNGSTSLLALQREKERANAKTSAALHGTNQ